MSIRQGEIWMVEFFPKVGSEIAKLRPAVVISHDSIGRLPLKTIVPITDWKENYAYYPWMIKIDKSSSNALSKTSAIDCFQIKNFSDERFVSMLGYVDEDMLLKIHRVVSQTLNPSYKLC